MATPDTVVSTRQELPVVRSAVPADNAAIRDVVTAAYGQYADVLAPDVFSRYLADLLDVERHARHGQLLVAEVAGQVRGFAAYYPDSSVQGFGWPRGWAGGRGLAVHPAGRGHGVARALLAACERLAVRDGAPVFAFHTASFMTDAIALYERNGYLRAPEFDVDMAAHFGGAAFTAIAFVRHLGRIRAAHADGVRRVRCTAKATLRNPSTHSHFSHSHTTPQWRISMTTQTHHSRTRRASGPAYYLGRPAVFWLAALAPRSAAVRDVAGDGGPVAGGLACVCRPRRSPAPTEDRVS